MSLVGFYFGPKVISVSECKSKKLLRSLQVSQQVLSAGSVGAEKVPEEIKLAITLSDELRRSGITAKEAVVSLAGKDVVVRTFEMPKIPAADMPAAVSFEAKKYIPFKLEDLIFDYQVYFDRSSKANIVLLAGVRKDTLAKYISIFRQLNLKVACVEYAGFSLLRALSSSHQSTTGLVGVVCVDFEEKDEVNFIALENGFPLFSRDITFSESPDLQNVTEADPKTAAEKLRSEIRMSLDYFKRKFPLKTFNKILLCTSRAFEYELGMLSSETGIPVQSVDAEKLCAPRAFSAGSLKAFGASIQDAVRIPIKINLITASAKSEERAQNAPVSVNIAASFLKGFQLDPKMLLLGVLICGLAFGWGVYNRQPIQKEIAAVISARPQIPGVNNQAGVEELTAVSEGFHERLRALDTLVRKQLYVTEPLNVIPQVMPEGVWLTAVSLHSAEGKATLDLSGVAYLSDNDKELQAVNTLASRLKTNAKFAKIFDEITVASLDRSSFKENSVSNFTIVCRSSRQR